MITIFLDGEKFIAEAIESVIAQTYEHWELILVDDGSIDRSTSIARSYEARYPGKVRYFEHEGHVNEGMSASRNLGVRHARGELVSLLDADDVWLPQKLARHVEILSSQPEASMLYGATQYWYSWSREAQDVERDRVWSNFGVQPNTLVQPPELLFGFLRDGRTAPCTCSTTFRRRVFDEIGGFENAFRGQYEDQVFYAKVCLQAPVFVTDECWELYRQHPRSSCSVAQQSGEADRAREAYLKWLEGYLRTKGVVDAELWGGLRKALRPYRYPRIHGLKSGAKRLGWRVSDGILRAVVPMLPDVLRRSKRRERRERG